MSRLLSVEPNSLRAWWIAIRPKTLMAAVMPILVGTFLPALPFSEMDWKMMTSALIAAISLTIGVNLINDALDFKRGADTKARIGPLRVTQAGLLSPQVVLATGFAALLFAFLFALPLIAKAGVGLLVLTLLAMLSAYFYTGGPYPLAYIGLGEVFVLLFYGLMATSTAYFLQTGFLSLDSSVASLQMGSLAMVMISINNLRDIKEDQASRKMTLAARFGERFGKAEITTALITPFALNLYWLATGRILCCFLPMTTLFMAVNLIRCIYKHPPSKIYNRYLGESALLMILFGILLILGTF